MIIAGTTVTINVSILKDSLPANLTDTSVFLDYEDPTGLDGSWPAIIDDALLGTVHVVEELAVAGAWRVWARVVNLDTTEFLASAGVIAVSPVGTVV